MITEIIDSMKPLTKKQKKILEEMIWNDKHLRKRILKEIKKKEDKK